MSDRLKSARLTAAAVLALLLFNYPFLAVFDLDADVFGVPAAVGLPVRRVGRRHRARRPGFEVLMLDTWVIVACSVAYLGAALRHRLLRRPPGRQPAAASSATATIYALSLAVYATSWTYYGSVGRAASTGIGFLPIYLGPTIMAVRSGGWCCARSSGSASSNRITSLADFVSSRYGKSSLLGGLVTVDRGGRRSCRTSRCSSRPSRTRSRSCARQPDLATGGRHEPARAGRHRRCTWRCCSPPSRSCSAPDTSTPPNDTRAWSPRSRSSRSSSWSRSSPSASTSRSGSSAASATCSAAPQAEPRAGRAVHLRTRPRATGPGCG